MNLPESNSTGHSLSPQPHLVPGMPPTPLGEGQLLLKTWCYRRPVVWLQKTVLTQGSISPSDAESSSMSRRCLYAARQPSRHLELRMGIWPLKS